MKIFISICCFFVYTSIVCLGQIISTVDSIGCYDVGGVAFDSHGNLFFTTFLGNQVKKMDTNYITTVIAGTGTSGFYGDGGPASNAELVQPPDITVDTLGNVFVADIQNQRIRKIDVFTGIISTIAGTGIGGWSTGGFSGDGGPASAAQLNAPSGVCFDKLGNLYIADNWNYRIRKINTFGIISTIAGNGTSGSTGDGGSATAATCHPNDGIIVDNSGNLYFTQSEYHTIRKVNTAGIISTIAGDTVSNVYNGDGIPATNAFMEPGWITIGGDGLMYISDITNARIRVIDNFGVIHTVAGNGILGSNGDGGPATSAEMNPEGLAFDKCGNLFFGQTNYPRIRKVAFNPHCWPQKVPEIIANDVVIFPNPTHEEITISGIKTNTKYSLFNIKSIIEQQGILKAGSNTLSIEALSPGLYILELTMDDGTRIMKKIIKL